MRSASARVPVVPVVHVVPCGRATRRVIVLLALLALTALSSVVLNPQSALTVHAAAKHAATALSTPVPPPPSPVSKNCGDDTSAYCTPPLVPHGGTVQHHPRVYLVFWGPDWRPDDPIITAMRQLFSNLAGSEWNNTLTQYYDHVNDPSTYIHNDVQLVDTWIDTSTPHSFTGSSYLLFQDLGEEVNQVVLPQNQSQNAQQLPPQTQPWTNSPDTQFLVFPQQHTSYDTQGIAGTFLEGDFFRICGAHDVYTPPGASGSGPFGPIIFGGIPYPTDLTNSTCGGPVVDEMTNTASHEYAEMATDPFGGGNGGSAWFTDESTIFKQQEIGDLCEQGEIPIPTYDTSGTLIRLTVTYLWDNSAPSPDGCVTNLGQEYYSGSGGKHTVAGAFLDDYISSHVGATLYGSTLDSEFNWVVVPSVCSPLIGCPLTEAYPVTGGQEQDFQSGSIYRNPATSPVQAFEVHGAIGSYYDSLRGPDSVLGLPTSDQQPVYASDGLTVIGQRNTFASAGCGASGGSAIYWSAGTNAHEMQGCIFQEYIHVGGAAVLGFPQQDEQPIGSGSSSGRVSYFNGTTCGTSTGSAIYYSGTTDAHAVQDCIYQAYVTYGGPTSGLGYPRTDEFPITNGKESDFQGGSITYSSVTGTTTVHLYTTSTSTINAHEVFATSTSGHLIEYSWRLSSGWTRRDLTALYGPSGGLYSDTGSTSYVDMEGGQQVVHAYGIAYGGTGLIEYYKQGSAAWREGLHPAPSGVSFHSTPSGFAYTQPGEAITRQSVSVVGTNGHLYNYQWAEGSGWLQVTDLSATSITPSGSPCSHLVGNPSAHPLYVSGQLQQDIWVFGNAGSASQQAQGTLCEYLGQNGSWTLKSALSAPSGVTMVGSPNAFSYTSTPFDPTVHTAVTFLGANGGHLYYRQWDQGASGFSAPVDLTASTGTQVYALVSGPNGHGRAYGSAVEEHLLAFGAGPSGSSGAHGVFYEYYRNQGAATGSWHLSTLLPGSVLLEGAPVGWSYILQGRTSVQMSVFFPAGDGHLHEWYYVDGTGWTPSDDGALSGVTLSGTLAPSGFSFACSSAC